MNDSIQAAANDYKSAQAAMTEAEQKLLVLNARKDDLTERLKGVTAALDKAKEAKLKALADYAEGRSDEAALNKCRVDVEVLERDRRNVQEMLDAMESSINGGDLTVKRNAADALEKAVWSAIEAALKSDPPKEVKTWIERLAAATFRASGRHVSTNFPFGPHIPSETEIKHLAEVAEGMKQEHFH